MIHRRQRNWGCRIHETELFGLRTIVLENERVRLSFLAGKGADLVEFNLKLRDMDFAWLAPAGIRNPLALHSTSPDTLATFIDFYPGGWQEIFPNAGEAATWAGAQYGQHGEVSALPWDVEVVEDGEQAVAVRFSVRGVKTPCRLERVVRLQSGEAAVSFDEVLANDAQVPFDAMWGHHITFGRPFLEPGATITVPDGVRAIPHGDSLGNSRRVESAEPFRWPMGVDPAGNATDYSVVPEQDSPSELFYLTDFPDATAWYEIRRPSGDLGMRVEWDAGTMPYLWYWQEFGASKGYPWYGRNYNIGLEPGSSYPTNGLPDAVANGSAIQLGPGGTRTMWLKASVIEE
jgi:hypothetical protein